MVAIDPKRAHVEVMPRQNHGVGFPERYLKVTNGIVRQGQRSLISVSDAGQRPFALLDAVDALVSEFGQAALDEQGITVPENFFTKRKDESGWHRDQVLAALAALRLQLEHDRASDAVQNQAASADDEATLQESFDAEYERRRARVPASPSR